MNHIESCRGSRICDSGIHVVVGSTKKYVLDKFWIMCGSRYCMYVVAVVAMCGIRIYVVWVVVRIRVSVMGKLHDDIGTLDTINLRDVLIIFLQYIFF